MIIDRIALAKQADNARGNVRPFVCHFVSLFVQVLTDGQTDGQTDGRTLPILWSPCFDKATRSINTVSLYNYELIDGP